MRMVMRAALAAAVTLGLAMPMPALARKVDPGYVARDTYYSGDVEKAYPLAVDAGEHWVAGLAAYRLQKYDEAFDQFRQVAEDAASDVWLTSGAAFWAARAASAAGHPDREKTWLRKAAETPWTFYGIVAERQLGLAPKAVFNQTVVAPEVRLAEAKDPLARLIRASTAANAFDAVSSVSDLAGFKPASYPSPDLEPEGGFTVDPALVYAIVRQESRFNPAARSRVGARGLMQLMPTTAALTAGDNAYKSNRALLNDPSVNLKIGQAYLLELANADVGDDLFMVIAAYNGGPGAVIKTIDRVGWGADPFIFIESLPARETRDYVERVMAGYWLYRRQFGETTASLDALVGGAHRISIAYDRSHPTARVEQASAANTPKIQLIPAANRPDPVAALLRQ